MSVQFFNGVGGSDKDMFNGSTGSAFTGTAVKWSAKITVPIAGQNGGRRTQVVEGASQGANLVTAINNATDCVQAILNMSKGYLTMFVIQCGLYRKDVEGTPVPAGMLSYGSGKCVNYYDASFNPVQVSKARSLTLYVPFIKDDVTQVQLKANIQALCTDGKLCALNFHDDDKDSFDVTPMTNGQDFTIKSYHAKELAMLTSNDVSSGGSDGVLRKSTN